MLVVTLLGVVGEQVLLVLMLYQQHLLVMEGQDYVQLLLVSKCFMLVEVVLQIGVGIQYLLALAVQGAVEVVNKAVQFTLLDKMEFLIQEVEEVVDMEGLEAEVLVVQE